MPRRLFLVLLLCATARAQIPPGTSRQETIGVLGRPKSSLVSGTKEILNYPEYIVRLENGAVVDFETIPPEGKRSTMVLSTPEKLPDPEAEAVLELPASPEPSRSPEPLEPPPGLADSVAVLQTNVPVTPAANPAAPVSIPVNSVSAPPATHVNAAKVRSLATPPVPVVSEPPALAPLADGLLLHDAKRVLASPLRKVGIALLVLILAYGLLEFLFSLFRYRRRFGVALWEGIPAPTNEEPLLMRPSTPPFPPRRPESLREWSLERLRKIEWHRFGRVVTEYYRILGYRAELTGAGSASSIDVQVYRPEENRPYLLVQCKALGERRVDGRLVQEFHRAMQAAEAESAAFFATGEFTEEARIFNHGKEYDLVGGEDFLTRISHLPPSRQTTLWQKATEDDDTASHDTVGMNLIPAS